MGNIQSILAPPPFVSLPASKVEDTILVYYTDLASSALKASIGKVSDETYGVASNLLKQAAPVALNKESDGTRDAWQTKRHSDSEWVVVNLGCSGQMIGFDIDTSTFTDSSPVTATIEGYAIEDKPHWETLLPSVPIKPNSHNFYVLDETPKLYSQIRLTTNPGGSVARLRCYGTIVPVWPNKISQPVNLSLANSGARIVRWTDTTAANKPNILLDGGKSMDDGWETPRSRIEDRNDMVIIQLGSPGLVKVISIDTSYFIGNAPQHVQVEGCFSLEDDPNMDYDVNWTELVPKDKVLPNSLKKFYVSSDSIFSHIRLTVFPDGGIQQISVLGFPQQNEHSKNTSFNRPSLVEDEHSITNNNNKSKNNSKKSDSDKLKSSEPLTPSASSSKSSKPIVAVMSTGSTKKHVKIQENLVVSPPPTNDRERPAKRKAGDAIKALPKKTRSSKKRTKNSSK